MNMKNKNIIVGITGGISAYKIPDFVRALIANGANVFTVLTDGGKQFVTPLALETLTKKNAYCDIYEMINNEPPHIHLASLADAIVIAPASADFIAQAVNGFGKELLSAILLASDCPVGFAPSMNSKMYNHPAVKQNILKLNELNYKVLEPETGELACGEGKGRLPKMETLLEFVAELVNK